MYFDAARRSVLPSFTNAELRTHKIVPIIPNQLSIKFQSRLNCRNACGVEIMKSSKKKIAGWALSGLIALFLIGASGVPKFMEWEGKEEMMGKLGWDTGLILKIGIIEVALAILILIPRVAFLATVLLTAYLGGAVATHVRIGDMFYFPIIVGVLAWIALGLRDPRVFASAFQPPRGPSTP
jgi:DoxX-like protein